MEESQQPISNQPPGAVARELSPIQAEALLFTVIALVMTCTWVFVNNAPTIRSAGFFAKLFAILVGTGLGAIGGLVGNALRKFVHPDAVWTTGGFWSLLWVKVFWKMGPQTIGLLAGTFIGIALVIR